MLLKQNVVASDISNTITRFPLLLKKKNLKTFKDLRKLKALLLKIPKGSFSDDHVSHFCAFREKMESEIKNSRTFRDVQGSWELHIRCKMNKKLVIFF